jgi:hypothetical protein
MLNRGSRLCSVTRPKGSKHSFFCGEAVTGTPLVGESLAVVSARKPPYNFSTKSQSDKPCFLSVAKTQCKGIYSFL